MLISLDPVAQMRADAASEAATDDGRCGVCGKSLNQYRFDGCYHSPCVWGIERAPTRDELVELGFAPREDEFSIL